MAIKVKHDVNAAPVAVASAQGGRARRQVETARLYGGGARGGGGGTGGGGDISVLEHIEAEEKSGIKIDDVIGSGNNITGRKIDLIGRAQIGQNETFALRQIKVHETGSASGSGDITGYALASQELSNGIDIWPKGIQSISASTTVVSGLKVTTSTPDNNGAVTIGLEGQVPSPQTSSIDVITGISFSWDKNNRLVATLTKCPIVVFSTGNVSTTDVNLDIWKQDVVASSEYSVYTHEFTNNTVASVRTTEGASPTQDTIFTATAHRQGVS